MLATNVILVSTHDNLPQRHEVDAPLCQGKLRGCGNQRRCLHGAKVRLHLVGCVEDIGLISIDYLKPIVDAIVSSLLRHFLLTAARLPEDVVTESGQVQMHSTQTVSACEGQTQVLQTTHRQHSISCIFNAPLC